MYIRQHRMFVSGMKTGWVWPPVIIKFCTGSNKIRLGPILEHPPFSLKKMKNVIIE